MKKIVQKIRGMYLKIISTHNSVLTAELVKSEKLDKKEDKAKIENLYRTGLDYYCNGEYKNALIFFDIAAECEHKDAQYVLGVMYMHGKGVSRNNETALGWYMKAAENGSVNARRNIEVCYRDGIGTKQSYREALVWFTRAAENGDIDSQFSTAVLYNIGHPDEVQQDYKMAYLWFKIAAENDHVQAQYALGILYHEGHGVPQDYTKALAWFTRVADRDKTGGAYNNIGHMYEKGLGMNKDYKKAIGFYLKASYKGNSMANDNIGQLFENGLGVLPDDVQAVEYYKQSAEKGNRNRQLHLGIMYLNGRPIFDVDKAIHCFQKAQEAGHPDAKTYLNQAKKARSTHHLFTKFQRDREDSVTLSKEEFEELRKQYQLAQEKAEQAERETRGKEKKTVILLAQLEIQKSQMQSIIDMACDSDDCISLISSKNDPSIKTRSSSLLLMEDAMSIEKPSTPNELIKASNEANQDYVDYHAYPALDTLTTAMIHKPNEKDSIL